MTGQGRWWKVWLLVLAAFPLLGSSEGPSGLHLRLFEPTETTVKIGERVRLRGLLTNRSRNSMLVVKPGDGSESGWREPYVYYSARRWTDGRWQEVERQPIGRCGLYNADWTKDVVTLKPGQSLELGDWLPDLESSFKLTPGKYRFCLHYRYSQGGNKESKAGFPVPTSLKGVSPYEVRSNDLIELTFTE